MTTTNLLDLEWKPFLVLFFGYAFYTWNRKSVSLVMPALIQEGLSSNVAGTINSAQNFAYAISKFVGGVLSDSVDPRLLVSSGLLFGGITTIVFSQSDSSWLFILFWFANGLAQGFGWPACAKLLKLRYSPSQFALLWSILSCSANVSVALNSIVSAYVLVSYGWKASIILAGTVSIAMGGLCYLLLEPSDPKSMKIAPKSTNEKSKTINSKGTVQENKKWFYILFEPLMLILLFTNFVLMLVKNSFTDWAQLYLIKENDQSPILASVFTGSLEIGGIAGTIASGYVSEIVMKSKKQSVYSESRRLLAVVGFMIGLCFSIGLFCSLPGSLSKIYLIILGFLLGAFIYGPINISGIVSSQTVPQHISGTVHAFFALAGNIGGIAAGLPVASFSHYFSWRSAFWLMDLLCIINTVVLIFSYRLWSIPK